jgi:hypothetical protein
LAHLSSDEAADARALHLQAARPAPLAPPGPSPPPQVVAHATRPDAWRKPADSLTSFIGKGRGGWKKATKQERDTEAQKSVLIEEMSLDIKYLLNSPDINTSGILKNYQRRI